MMNVQRMMRPGMANPNANPPMMNANNSNLRHLLQPQNQVSDNYKKNKNKKNSISITSINCFSAAARKLSTDVGHARSECYDES